MRLQESGEMYLETIYILSKSNANVHSIDVGERMGYSKPSVSRAMSILKSGGYITMAADGTLNLTTRGREIAEKIYERHTILTELLVSLGVDNDTASEDACRLEHDISDKSLEAIKQHLIKEGKI
ncbi:MAG: metal-dependent transcriptional regulator [Clostridia bacterium]|nr:metal-dependent transcriptional regulator [Clostridia bacterium]